MIGMSMGDEDRLDGAQGLVLKQRGDYARSGIHKEVALTRLQEIARAGLAGIGLNRATAEDRDAHRG
jgi:hypothetical protein